MPDALCQAFLVKSSTTFWCSLPAGHEDRLHRGPGAASNTWDVGKAPIFAWTDRNIGAYGTFRKSDDNSGKTPYDGLAYGTQGDP